MDVVLFVAILVVYIWAVLPSSLHGTFLTFVFPVAALGLAAAYVWRRRQRLRELGLRIDNLPLALPVYCLTACGYAALVLFAHREELRALELDRTVLFGAPAMLSWAFLQQLCLVGFLLPRLRELTGRSLVAALLAAGIFAFFHLPNPFLTLYTLVGGLLLATLYLRVPNLIAASVAHAVASALAAGALPKIVTGSMKVGPGYW